MQKQRWDFEVKNSIGVTLSCLATKEWVVMVKEHSGELVSTWFRNAPQHTDWHKYYTVTSGTVPPWLEKPLPKVVAFWVESIRTKEMVRASADDFDLTIGTTYKYTPKDDYRNAETFRSSWRILGSPDLPDWLKTEATNAAS